MEGKPTLEQAAEMVVVGQLPMCAGPPPSHARQFARSEYSLPKPVPRELQLRRGFDCHLKCKSAGSQNSGGGEEEEEAAAAKYCSGCPGWCQEKEVQVRKRNPPSADIAPGYTPWLWELGWAWSPHPYPMAPD